MTFEGQMAVRGGRSSGFDYLRILLAASVIVVHSVSLSYGRELELWRSPLGVLCRSVLPMFFALSGFLVAGSLERTRTLPLFLSLRAIKIFPALMVEVVVSALLIGPLVTQSSLPSYFSSAEFHRYFLNMIGDVHFTLPGVFLQNPTPSLVNRQLWTVPFELYCYIGLSGLALVGLLRNRVIAPLAAVAVTLAYILYRAKVGLGAPFLQMSYPGTMLVVAFLWGVSIYLLKRYIPYSWGLCSAASVIAVVLISSSQYAALFAVAPLAYITVFLGLQNPAKSWIIAGADYSYGMYLYGYVIQQLVAYWGEWTHHWWLNASISIVASAALAALSWHGVEKHALKLRRPLAGLERRWIRWRTPPLTSAEA